MASQFLPVLITFGLAFATGLGLLAFAALAGQRSRHDSPEKRDVYESGVPILDRAHKRISVHFYLVALVFVVLDVEVAFLYPWALTYAEQLASAPWVVLLDMLAFISVLALVYGWLWRSGVFDWGRLRTPDTKGESPS
jgi:NADH:ubiquinone oxidoreductase subunit 3 (subunit A)